MEGILRFNVTEDEWDAIPANVRDIARAIWESFMEDQFSTWKGTIEVGLQEGLVHLQMAGILKTRKRMTQVAGLWKRHVRNAINVAWGWHEDVANEDRRPLREINWVRMRKSPNGNNRRPTRADLDYVYDEYLEDETKKEPWGEGGTRPARNTTSKSKYREMVALARSGVEHVIAIQDDELGGMASRYPGSYTKILSHAQMVKLPIERKIYGLWIHGPAGSGKSAAVNHGLRRVMMQVNRDLEDTDPGVTAWPDLLYEFQNEPHGWEDGYKGQPIGLMDEFGPGSIRLTKLNRMMDSRPCSIAQRHSAGAICRLKMLIVVSNHEPEGCWPRIMEAHPHLAHTVRRRFNFYHLEGIPQPNGTTFRDDEQQEDLISLIYLQMMRALREGWD